MAQPATPPLRILMLHGYTQSASLFDAKTRALSKALTRAFPHAHLSYVPAPHRLRPSDTDTDPDPERERDSGAPEAYGWWRRRDRVVDDGKGKEVVVVEYEGLEEGLGAVAGRIRAEGPFDGVVGFSQGAAAGAMVASLLEGRRRRRAFEEAAGGMAYPASFRGSVDGCVQGPLKFAVCYSGFRAPGGLYGAFYEPRIGTKLLSVLGQVDVVVEEARAMQLVAACEGGEGRVVVHPGGHFVPSQKPWLDAVVGFVKECMEGEERKEDKEEERVEDMDVPF